MWRCCSLDLIARSPTTGSTGLESRDSSAQLLPSPPGHCTAPSAGCCFRGHIWRQTCQQSISLLLFILFLVLHFSSIISSYSCLLPRACFEERVASHLCSARLGKAAFHHQPWHCPSDVAPLMVEHFQSKAGHCSRRVKCGGWWQGIQGTLL